MQVCCSFPWWDFCRRPIREFREHSARSRRRLLIDGEFVLRYEPDDPGDGLPRGEGAFLACSFWLMDNYVLFDPVAGRMLGNFPQAYSHVGVINCALNLGRQAGPADDRAEAQPAVDAA